MLYILNNGYLLLINKINVGIKFKYGSHRPDLFPLYQAIGNTWVQYREYRILFQKN